MPCSMPIPGCPATTTSPRRNAASSPCSAHAHASAHAALGLHALQHRGQEAAGIVSFDGEMFHSHRAVGLIGDTFSRRSVIEGLPGHAAIGHARYSTTGASMMRNVQPLFADFAFGGLAVAHNGNLTNAMLLRRRLVEAGSLFQSTSDTEVIIHLIARSQRQDIVGRVVDALREVEGAWSLVGLFNDCILGGRDPLGVRPLVLGQLDGAWFLASETCALDILGAEFVRDVEPGEIVVIDRHGVQSLHPFAPEPNRFCIFEYVYFSRPDSVVEGKGVYEVRKRIGAELARESGVPADVVVPVPDSGVPAAIGYAQESGLGFELGIIRNHYVGRTFIEPTDHIRNLGVKLKHNANRVTLAGKRVDPGRRQHRARHHLDQDRGHGPRGGGLRGAHADRQPAHHPQLLLRRRHARAQQAPGCSPLGRGDGGHHRGRQPGLPVDRRALPGGRRGAAGHGPAAILRRLLHRRLPDAAVGHRG